MRITRIVPIYRPDGEAKEIYYPVWLYVFYYHVKRRVFGDIKGKFVVMVDGINGRSYLADVFPQLEEVETDGRILEPRITDEESRELAVDKAEAFLFRKFAYLKFSYRLEQKAFTYKLFWVMKTGNSYLLLDSITGDEIEVQKIEKSEQLVNDSG